VEIICKDCLSLRSEPTRCMWCGGEVDTSSKSAIRLIEQPPEPVWAPFFLRIGPRALRSGLRGELALLWFHRDCWGELLVLLAQRQEAGRTEGSGQA
jgi:hypothetical protein